MGQSPDRQSKGRICQSLQDSSLSFTSPFEFNAIFRDGFTLRLKLNGWSKIRDPVTAKFKDVTVIVTCTLLCGDDVTYVRALWNFQKADLEPYPYGKKYTTFSFPIHGTLASNICLRDMQWFSHILDVFTRKIRRKFFDFNIVMNQNKRRLHKTWSDR